MHRLGVVDRRADPPAVEEAPRVGVGPRKADGRALLRIARVRVRDGAGLEERVVEGQLRVVGLPEGLEVQREPPAEGRLELGLVRVLHLAG